MIGRHTCPSQTDPAWALAAHDQACETYTAEAETTDRS